MGNAKYDWQAIEADYVTGKLSLRDLAAKHGCVLSTIGRQASNGDWDSKREQYRHDNATAVQEAKKETSVLTRLKYDELTEGSCDAFIALIRLEANRLLRIAKACAQSGEGMLSIDSQDLKYLAETLKKLQDVKYRALDIPPVSIVESRVAQSPAAQVEAELHELMAEFGPDLFSVPEVPSAQA